MILTAPFWCDTLLGALAPSKFSNPKADKKWTPKTPPEKPSNYHKELQLLKLKTGVVTKDNGKHWLTENKGEMVENLEDVCAHTHAHTQETEREERKSRKCSPKKAGTHQVSDLSSCKLLPLFLERYSQIQGALQTSKKISPSVLQMIEIFRTFSKAIQITMTSVVDPKNEPEYLEFVCQ